MLFDKNSTNNTHSLKNNNQSQINHNMGNPGYENGMRSLSKFIGNSATLNRLAEDNQCSLSSNEAVMQRSRENRKVVSNPHTRGFEIELPGVRVKNVEDKNGLILASSNF